MGLFTVAEVWLNDEVFCGAVGLEESPVFAGGGENFAQSWGFEDLFENLMLEAAFGLGIADRGFIVVVEAGEDFALYFQAPRTLDVKREGADNGSFGFAQRTEVEVPQVPGMTEACQFQADSAIGRQARDL